ncbi:MAG: helix-turn-helix domain-containing protein [Actinomycetota bacterium]|nr:helix-turn-helix domain-containing protein [Actinomycetota bacterium]
MRALDHPLRVGFLRLLADRQALTPREALGLLDGGEVALSSLAYHVRLLAQLELVEPAGDQEAEGLPFRTTSTGELALAVLGLPPREENGG